MSYYRYCVFRYYLDEIERRYVVEFLVDRRSSVYQEIRSEDDFKKIKWYRRGVAKDIACTANLNASQIKYDYAIETDVYARIDGYYSALVH